MVTSNLLQYNNSPHDESSKQMERETDMIYFIPCTKIFVQQRHGNQTKMGNFIITTAYAQCITFFLINITNPFTQKFCIKCAISEIAINQLLKLHGVCQISRNPRLPQIPNKPNEKYMQRHTNTQLTPNKCAATVGIQINYFLKERSTKQKSNQIIIRSNAARANYEKN